MNEPSPYELARNEKIKRNEERLQSLGLMRLKPRKVTPPKTPRKRSPRKNLHPIRRSPRLAKGAPIAEEPNSLMLSKIHSKLREGSNLKILSGEFAGKTVIVQELTESGPICDVPEVGNRIFFVEQTKVETIDVNLEEKQQSNAKEDLVDTSKKVMPRHNWNELSLGKIDDNEFFGQGHEDTGDDKSVSSYHWDKTSLEKIDDDNNNNFGVSQSIKSPQDKQIFGHHWNELPIEKTDDID